MANHPWEESWIKGEKIGNGAQGDTYHALNLTDASVKGVLKVLRNKNSPQSRGRMYREAVSLDVLSAQTDRVPKVLEHNADKHADPSVELYMVMEFIPGQTLKQYVDSASRCDLPTAIAIAQSLCETLAKAHAVEIYHRDIKPDNIILRDPATLDVVLVDFGLSFNLNSIDDATKVGERFRSDFLTLPETTMQGGNRRDPRSDITMVCGVFYYLLTGNYPIHLQGPDGKPPHLRSGQSIKEVQPPVPAIAQIEAFLSMGFSQNIESRFQTIEDFQNRIRLVHSHESNQAPRLDPVAISVQVADRIRRYDRKTQLANYSAIAQKVMSQIYAYAEGFNNKLSGFTYQAGQMGFDAHSRKNLKLPVGIEPLDTNLLMIQLSLPIHKLDLTAFLAIGAKGEQCVVLIQQTRIKHKAPEGVEVLWYQNTGELPHLDDVRRAIDDFLTQSMLEIDEFVQAANTTKN